MASLDDGWWPRGRAVVGVSGKHSALSRMAQGNLGLAGHAVATLSGSHVRVPPSSSLRQRYAHAHTPHLNPAARPLGPRNRVEIHAGIEVRARWSFDEASHVNDLLERPDVARDLDHDIE